MNQPTFTARTYVLVFVGLMVLLIATFGTDFVNLGAFNFVINITIAVAKGLLVALFFMGLIHTEHTARLYSIVGLFWLMIMLLYTLSDVFTRSPAS